MLQMQQPGRKFLELSIVGSGKALYIPSDAILTYEFVPEGKNPNIPNAGTFIRYDYGEGLSFAFVDQSLDDLKTEVGTDGFLDLELVDDAPIYIKNHLIEAIQEVDDEGDEATRLSVNLGGQVGSLYVKNSFQDIKQKRGG